MAQILVGIFAGKEKEEILSVEYLSKISPEEGYCDEIADISRGGFLAKDIDQISSSGYVVHTLEAALYCWANTQTYRDAVLMAVNMGDDTDTTAAVVGQIVGAYVGLSGIPDEWQKAILFKDEILSVAGALYNYNLGGIHE
jgi:ADP-ribosyl-[dinitrogen reductase] hydrolase